MGKQMEESICESPTHEKRPGTPTNTKKKSLSPYRQLSFLDAYTSVGTKGGAHENENSHLAVGHHVEEHETFMMQLLARTSGAIAIIGALVLIVGCVLAFINVTLLALKALPIVAPTAYAIGDSTRNLTLNLIRSQLGHIIVFTLEILVAADVIETLAVPVHAQSFDTLGKISVIVVVRTVLAFFLEKELEAVDEELRHEKPVELPANVTVGPSALSMSLDEKPSLMLMVTVGLITSALASLIAARLGRPIPVAELGVIALGLGWCSASGSVRVLLSALGICVAVSAGVNSRQLIKLGSAFCNYFLGILVPKPTWALHQFLFWAAGCSATAWATSAAFVFAGMQKSCERLWLATLLVSMTFYAVNSFPVFALGGENAEDDASSIGSPTHEARSRATKKEAIAGDFKSKGKSE